MLLLFLANHLTHLVSPLPEGEKKPPWLKKGHLDNWELIREIGSGGSGDVFLAGNSDNDIRALKIFSPKSDDRRAFDLEFDGIFKAKSIGEHPYIVPIESIGKKQYCMYYTMPLADHLDTGPDCKIHTLYDYRPHTLYNRIIDNDLTEPELLELASNILDALDFLHGKGLVHRDVKPDNIMRVRGVWCLGDLGLISWRRPRNFAGTPGYYPERKSFRADTSSDIYALGKTLYCAATGMKPTCYPLVPEKYDYDRYSNLRSIYRAAVEGKYETANEMKRDVTAAWDQLL